MKNRLTNYRKIIDIMGIGSLVLERPFFLLKKEEGNEAINKKCKNFKQHIV